MKRLSRWLTLQNIVIMLGALYIDFQIYELPTEVKILKEMKEYQVIGLIYSSIAL